MLRATTFRHAVDGEGEVRGRVVLAHDERHIRRKVITLENGEPMLVDLAQAVALEAGDRLVTEDGGTVEIVAADEALYEIFGRDGRHLAELAWHIGNRHLAAQIESARILILRDHVIRTMLEGLGASVEEITGPFSPLRGAYHHAGEQAHDHHHPREHGR
jgi:urease accessory protein